MSEARNELDRAMLEWMADAAFKPDAARFERLALDLFAFQFEHCDIYRAFCEGRGRTPVSVKNWRDIPAVPTDAFKEYALRTFPESRVRHVFRTSGTTSSQRGTLYLDRLDLYEASLLPTFRHYMLPDLPEGGRTLIRALASDPAEASDSSLSHMFGVVVQACGSGASGFDVANGTLDTESCVHQLRRAIQRGTPVTLCGPAFAFVHLLDSLEHADERIALPERSRIMETGGFKGRSRAVERRELYAAISEYLGVPEERIVNQYGMTELGSQFYDGVLRAPDAPRRKEGPPWARVRVIDPETASDAAPGEIGFLVVVDLANTGSSIAIQTADLGRRVGDGFEVLGRSETADLRGCSIAIDSLLGGKNP